MGVLYVAMAMCSDQIQIGVFCKYVLVYIRSSQNIWVSYIKNICQFMICSNAESSSLPRAI